MSDHIDIEYISKLARVEFSDKEKQKLSDQLDKILEYLEKLNQVDVENVEPMAHAQPIYNVMDEDHPMPGFTPKEALLNAPEQRDDQLVVPKVVE